MRVAVVGAGVYGCTIAVELARAGHQVGLYERHQGLLWGATRGNQGRLHAGYHYPRSPETAAACQADSKAFAARFPDAVDRSARHCYAVAKQGSLTGAPDYLVFCDRLGGGHVVADSPLLQGVEVCVRVDEAFVDVGRLRAQLAGELAAERVSVHLGCDVSPDTIDADFTVVAAYGRGWPAPLRWEVCEVALVELGAHYTGRSFVVMDGAFTSLDPVPGTRLHALYDVEASVHAANEGLAPIVPEYLAPLLDRGPVWTSHSRRDAMLARARRFFCRLGMPSPAGSLFTVRAVLPGVDATDARPTLYRRDGRVLHVLAGKLDGAVAAAGRVRALAGDMIAV